MNLILIRHAEAVSHGAPGIASDEDRPLTDNGRAQARALAEAMQKRQYRPDALATSPLVRAVQTAEEMAAVWGLSPENVLHCDHLAPGGRRRKLSKFLLSLTGSTIALVGHQPDIEELTGWLIGTKQTMLEFAKGGAACVKTGLDLGKACGTLQWLVTPEWV